jgi:hypothetical protein
MVQSELTHKANRLYLHGYVMCDQLIAGHLAHSCQHGPAPHRIKVCITKKGNEKVWREVLRRVVEAATTRTNKMEECEP